MWTRVFAALVLLLIASFAIQALIPRRARARKMAPRLYMQWDVAPVIGFFGAILLALSFAEAVRREVIAAWGWGSASGLIASASVWAALVYRQSHPARNAQRETTGPAAWRLVRRYGAVLLFAVLGLYLAVRLFGAALEVFIAGALGVLVIAMAVAVFARNRHITEERNGK